ncbi:QueT transporter family protein [Olsenella profusa]|uniref:QueT transporter family protein n=1 Tax=Olsenella profusa TaxID=138595 RepID=A0ABS2F0R4_9ACTN|nr:QueT transporter family protein [Olsenella profusa]MBM6774400.1 QueT transporter family protein [Olsenella profusa]
MTTQHHAPDISLSSSEARTQRIAHVAVIAAAYAALTLIALLFLGSLAWGPVQFRVSEALCVLALFTPEAIPGLALGCAIANVANIVLSGTGMLGMLDVAFGTLATALGAWFTWKNRRRPALALLGPVVANALIVPAYLPLMLQGIGFYTIPFTNIALDGAYPAMYLFGLLTTGAGEAVVMYVLGLPLSRALRRTSLPRMLGADADGAAQGTGSRE